MSNQKCLANHQITPRHARHLKIATCRLCLPLTKSRCRSSDHHPFPPHIDFFQLTQTRCCRCLPCHLRAAPEYPTLLQNSGCQSIPSLVSWRQLLQLSSKAQSLDTKLMNETMIFTSLSLFPKVWDLHIQLKIALILAMRLAEVLDDVVAMAAKWRAKRLCPTRETPDHSSCLLQRHARNRLLVGTFQIVTGQL